MKIGKFRRRSAGKRRLITPRQVLVTDYTFLLYVSRIRFIVCSLKNNTSLSLVELAKTLTFSSASNRICCAGFLGYYLNLEEIDALHIPVPVNLIFVGFNGDGNQGIAIFISYGR